MNDMLQPGTFVAHNRDGKLGITTDAINRAGWIGVQWQHEPYAVRERPDAVTPINVSRETVPETVTPE